MNPKPFILVAIVALIAGAIYFINSNSARRVGSSESVEIVPRTASAPKANGDSATGKFLSAETKVKRYELAKEITTPDGFINTDGKPVTIGELVGKKVVLVDFWTYSCINCQRTTPYLNAWYEKYKDKGFVIIGVHTPEFEFEKDYNNVKAAVEKFGIKFPVVLDNDYSTWTAYKNRYWPRKYLIDIDGYIVYDHIGEGAYEETEKNIQEALSERMKILGEDQAINQSLTKEAATPNESKTPEIYFGSARNSGFSKFVELVGSWDVKEEFAENKDGGAKIILRYQAKDVYFVAGSESGARIKVIKDNKLIGEQTINAYSLYKLVQDQKSGSHTLKIIIEDPGLRAFTFTFG